MKNSEVAKKLREIADLLEVQEVPFKPKAYRQAARSIENLPEKLEAIAVRGEIAKIPGVGISIAKKIQELLDTGRLKYLDDLRKETHHRVLVSKKTGKEVVFDIDGVKVTAVLTEKYERITVRSPKDFEEGSFRTVDIGAPGYSKLIRGLLKSTREWATVTYLISREIREDTKERLRSAALNELKKHQASANG